MKRYCVISILAIGLAATCVRGGMPVEQGDIPVAPIATSDVLGFEGVYHLKNAALEILIDPSSGTIVYMKLVKGVEFLSGTPPERIRPGGNWLWPVDRDHWHDADIPPAYFAQDAWEANAWKGADGSQSCRLTRRYGSPANVRVTRTIKLHQHQQAISIRQRIERTGASDLPVVLWNVTRIMEPGQAVIPAEVQDRPQAPGSHIDTCPGTLVCDASVARDLRFCTAAGQNWAAVQKGEFVLIQKVHNLSSRGGFPAPCKVSLATGTDQPYVDLESRSEEQVLGLGDRIANSVSLRCFAVETNVPPCRLAGQVKALLGEQ